MLFVSTFISITVCTVHVGRQNLIDLLFTVQSLVNYKCENTATTVNTSKTYFCEICRLKISRLERETCLHRTKKAYVCSKIVAEHQTKI